MKHTNFAFSIHKSGSSLFFGILKDVCQESNRLNLNEKKQFSSIPNELFRQGLGETPLKDPAFPKKYNIKFDNPDILYCGFRWVPAFFQGDIEKNAIIMGLVRDPRDVLTSHYFSMLKSHVIPKGKTGDAMEKNRKRLAQVNINDYMDGQIKTGFWLERLLRLTELKDNEGSKFWRYEDIIFEKKKWLSEILDHMSMNLPAESKEKILLKWDILPSKEDTSKHIRKVIPGDHKEKLQPATIEKMNDYFSEILDCWNYS